MSSDLKVRRDLPKLPTVIICGRVQCPSLLNRMICQSLGLEISQVLELLSATTFMVAGTRQPGPPAGRPLEVLIESNEPAPGALSPEPAAVSETLLGEEASSGPVESPTPRRSERSTTGVVPNRYRPG